MAEMVNHPDHYNQGKRETIEEMRLMFGDQAVADFCRLSAYKYMRRADYKGKKEEDLAKAEWYMDYLDKMERERIARLAAPKPEPIHVVLDTYTKRDEDRIDEDRIDPSQNAHVVNYAHNDNIVQKYSTTSFTTPQYREERWPG